MRQDIEFNAEGTTLRGWLYLPGEGHRPFPTIVMAHGFSAVKEMYLDSYAEVFAKAGMASQDRRSTLGLRCAITGMPSRLREHVRK